MARLVIFEEVAGAETIFEVFDLATTRVLIGSSPDNDLVLEAPEVDPGHASLELRQNQWVLQDLGGPGGTVVNGRIVEGPNMLQDNDLIEIGTIKLKFELYELPIEEVEEVEEEPQPDLSPDTGGQVSGRLWFATVAGGTVAIIFIILLLLVIADYLDLLQISDLLPPWL